MLFATVWGGWLWWLGWVFAPRITVAVLATLYYLDTNPVLVVFAWIWALGGESTEKGSCSTVPMGASIEKVGCRKGGRRNAN